MHRDLKPDNIGLVRDLAQASAQTLGSLKGGKGGKGSRRGANRACKDNIVKILDLGEARAMRPQSGDVELTSPRLRGTPLYQAPDRDFVSDKGQLG